MKYIVAWSSVLSGGGCEEVSALSREKAIAKIVEKHSAVTKAYAFTQHEWDTMAQDGGDHR